MLKDLDLNKLDNPPIQVVWEDYPENFTQERLKSVKTYFQKKYNTTSVNLVTKLKKTEDVEDNVDVSLNIMDKNYQHELLKGILESKNQGELYDEIIKIDPSGSCVNLYFAHYLTLAIFGTQVPSALSTNQLAAHCSPLFRSLRHPIP